MEALLTTDSLLALVTLSAMEIVLGIDNIVFISIVVAKVPLSQQAKARSLGISMALIIRIGLLFCISWIMSLTEPWFSIFGKGFSGREVILCAGGLFLIAKATKEIHDKVENIPAHAQGSLGTSNGFALVLGQILLLDIVFSLDSVITAVGMVDQIAIMVIAMVIAMIVMLFSAKAIGEFVEHNPTIKILALSFLLLIGVLLLVEGMGGHVNKGYIYFAMAFSLGVELLNMRLRRKSASSD